MLSTEFIIEKLKVWKAKYPSLKLKYAFNNRTQEHIVQVERGDVYKSKEFQDEIITLWREFGKEYKGEDFTVTPPNDPRDDGKDEELSNILFEFGY